MRTSTASEAPAAPRHHFRFHESHAHLSSAFGDDWFGVRAEGFARFFGTPTFLISQTVLVIVWIVLNVVGLTQFDVYPFILLNLAFSLQAAYAAPHPGAEPRHQAAHRRDPPQGGCGLAPSGAARHDWPIAPPE
ncbi:MAG: DUF1003 domain-containing protein [Deltaproteobacteria bacterium]|nr:MAG: DUF1003 domain-containing protein [Deltaproteobacteria bacterium]